ncbi:hypothetical protein PHMEG_00030854 [Phytophthora megakarya]|uniref:Uncharacterized protein n=1 Tax=Phytophthora megakarya TaxID=4795 RepID=A0A225UZL4_9STRA|nr:hypothetical protein PHMEG_00030854 [Phytophthora megakarya]
MGLNTGVEIARNFFDLPRSGDAVHNLSIVQNPKYDKEMAFLTKLSTNSTATRSTEQSTAFTRLFLVGTGRA